MKRPYCRIDGKAYQLEYVNNVLRFPNIYALHHFIDYNKLIIRYIKGITKLDYIFDKYITTGSSYELVWNSFSTNGINNHLVTQGKGKLKSFRLYK